MDSYRYALNLAYNGKNFHGWQIQPNAETIQQKIKNALHILLKQKICIYGAGRTDSGVHATFFVAHFDAKDKITDLNKFCRSLNGLLNNEIAIFNVVSVDKNFHSRFDAISRTYKYVIHTNNNPFVLDFSHKFVFDLDVNRMNEAAKVLLEYNDFKSFEKSHSDSKTSICDLKFAQWEKISNGYVFTITADRFLRNMVRSIVGTMLDIGQNRISIDLFREIIESKNRQKAGKSADAQGLYLVDIQYKDPVNLTFEKGRRLSKFSFF
ncbi:MAG: tRNA pseudouridine(38-40) synthase TruA [Bacteroidales bacterium]|nr:tRNA pseudouridine(38-40) synthase TruA [Bacteroidales bacterium]